MSTKQGSGEAPSGKMIVDPLNRPGFLQSIGLWTNSEPDPGRAEVIFSG